MPLTTDELSSIQRILYTTKAIKNFNNTNYFEHLEPCWVCLYATFWNLISFIRYEGTNVSYSNEPIEMS
jgi:hypothetical protein